MKRPDTYLCSPYIVNPPPSTYCVDMANTGSGGWPTANRVIYVPFSLPFAKLMSKISAAVTSGTTGNYDIGVYDALGTSGGPGNRLVSSGSTAVTAAGIKTFTPTNPILLEAGLLYYAALWHSSTQSWARWDTLLAGVIAGGLAQEAGASALPSSATPARPASGYIPVIALEFAQ